MVEKVVQGLEGHDSCEARRQQNAARLVLLKNFAKLNDYDIVRNSPKAREYKNLAFSCKWDWNCSDIMNKVVKIFLGQNIQNIQTAKIGEMIPKLQLKSTVEMK